MPWFPDFANAVELARRQTRAAAQADPVAQYFTALNKGDTHVLEDVWPGQVVIYDPRAGEVRGHRQVRQFISRNLSWLAGLHARTETVASTSAGGRAVVELLARVDHDGRELAWPVAVVAESPDDMSVVFRTYCSQWPVDERRHVRPPILKPGPASPGDVVGRYQAALAAGDAEAVVNTFAPDGYFRGSFGPRYAHRGTAELRSFSPGASARVAASACSSAPRPTTGCAAPWNTTSSAGAATTCRPRPDSGFTSAARTGCWLRSASTTMSKRPSGTPRRRSRDKHAAAR